MNNYKKDDEDEVFHALPYDDESKKMTRQTYFILIALLMVVMILGGYFLKKPTPNKGATIGAVLGAAVSMTIWFAWAKENTVSE